IKYGRVVNRLHSLIFVRWLVKRRDDDWICVNLLNSPVCPVCGVTHVRDRSLELGTAAHQYRHHLPGDLVGLVKDAVFAGTGDFDAVKHSLDLRAVLGDDVLPRRQQVANGRGTLFYVLSIVREITLGLAGHPFDMADDLLDPGSVRAQLSGQSLDV